MGSADHTIVIDQDVIDPVFAAAASLALNTQLPFGALNNDE